MREICCKSNPDCKANPEFRIITVRESSFAGPDLYSDETFACEQHVGELLGYQPDATNPEEIFWKVYSYYE